MWVIKVGLLFAASIYGVESIHDIHQYKRGPIHVNVFRGICDVDVVLITTNDDESK